MHSRAATRAHRTLLGAAGALCALVALLAAMEYHWLERVREADAERIRRGARSRALELARTVDRELTLAFVWLRAGADASALAQRWRAWSRLAAHPRIVRSVGVIRNGSFLDFDPGTDALRAADWPPALEAARRLFRSDPRSGPPLPSGFHPRGPVDPDTPALLGPPLGFGPGRSPGGPPPGFRPRPTFTVVLLDGDYLRRELVPELAGRLFEPSGDSDYGIRIDRRDDPAQIVFLTDPGIPATGTVDAEVSLFGLDPEALSESERPRRELPTFVGPRVAGHWRLRVRHRKGSAEAVVAEAGRRNLALSGGTLVLLLGSAGLVVASARRARRLADRQLEFVAGVSHELRTPLAAIRVAGDNLRDGLVDDRETAREYGGVVLDQQRRLSDMIEGVLDLAGTYSGRRKWRLAPVAVGPVVGEACASLGPLARSNGVRIDAAVEDGLPLVRAERASLVRVLTNLVENAIRHGGDGGRVEVRASPGPADGERVVRVEVRDHGRGIPADDVPHVFEPFFRGREAVLNQTPGSGLGLALVQRLVVAHGGRVEVATAPGRGSIFTVVLPARAEAE